MQNTTEKQQLDTLAKMVSNMRKAQNAYFRSQSRANLDKAKTLEKLVDRLISDLEIEQNTSIQPSLFG